MDEKQLLSQIIETAVAAGKVILQVYNSDDFGVKIKEDKSPLTLADQKAHDVIMEELSKTDYPVLSEEGAKIEYRERSQWTKFWLVDPLDGTKEFIKRNGEFTVNIALIENQKPIMGVVYVPVSDEIYAGGIENGAFLISGIANLLCDNTIETIVEQKSEKIPLPKSSGKYTVVGSRSHMSSETEAFIGELKTKHGELDFISKGSSLKLCMIANGKADIYPRFAPTMEWDTAAGHAVIVAAGGKVIHHDSENRLLYNKENLLNPWFIASM